jgi:hypothetical protein
LEDNSLGQIASQSQLSRNSIEYLWMLTGNPSFPWCLRALERIEGLFDHAPILLTTGIPKPPSKHRFKFDLGWLQREGFHDMVKNVWERPIAANSPIQRWNSNYDPYIVI